MAFIVLSLGIAAAVAVGLLAGAWRAGHAAGPVAGFGECGRCGYSARGIAALCCPECGADLRRVGIVPAETVAVAPPVRATAAVAVFILLSSGGLWLMLWTLR